MVSFAGLFAYIDVFHKGIYGDEEVLQSLRTQHILRGKIGQILRIRSDENRQEIQTLLADQKAQDSTLYGDGLDLVGNRHPRRADKEFKGQLISKFPFGVFKSPKKPTIFFKDFCPSL